MSAGGEGPTKKRGAWKDVWWTFLRGFAWTLGSIIATFAAAYVAGVANLLHLDLAWQVALALSVGLLVSVVALGVKSWRTAKERDGFRRRIQTLKVQIEARPRHWVLAESGQIHLTSTHNREAYRFNSNEHDVIFVTLKGVAGDVFDIEVTTSHVIAWDAEADRGHLVIDSKEGVPEWKKMLRLESEWFLYVGVILPKERQSAAVNVKIDTLVPK